MERKNSTGLVFTCWYSGIEYKVISFGEQVYKHIYANNVEWIEPKRLECDFYPSVFTFFSIAPPWFECYDLGILLRHMKHIYNFLRPEMKFPLLPTMSVLKLIHQKLFKAMTVVIWQWNAVAAVEVIFQSIVFCMCMAHFLLLLLG